MLKRAKKLRGRKLLASWTFALCAALLVAIGDARADVEILRDDSRLSEGLKETQSLQGAVAQGRLPEIAARLPQAPSVYVPKAPAVLGKHGGEWRMLVNREKDVRLGFVYGYARLVVYNEELDFVPDILEEVTVEDGRIFTLKLRRGHRWSDGAPFTSEDFRYYWEDVANNEELSPVGPPASLLIEEELPTITYPDLYTVRYAWSNPNPFFLPSLARALPLTIYRPSHYLKQFHADHADPEALAQRVEENEMRDWAQHAEPEIHRHRAGRTPWRLPGLHKGL